MNFYDFLKLDLTKFYKNSGKEQRDKKLFLLRSCSHFTGHKPLTFGLNFLSIPSVYTEQDALKEIRLFTLTAGPHFIRWKCSATETKTVHTVHIYILQCCTKTMLLFFAGNSLTHTNSRRGCGSAQCTRSQTDGIMSVWHLLTDKFLLAHWNLICLCVGIHQVSSGLSWTKISYKLGKTSSFLHPPATILLLVCLHQAPWHSRKTRWHLFKKNIEWFVI